jgi:hypothetical protein
MTGNDLAEGVGTRAHRAGVRRFLTYTVTMFVLVGAIAVALQLMRHGSGPGSLPPAGAVAAAIAFALVIILAGWWGFRVVDEFEAHCSAIAYTVGFFAQMILVMGWSVLWFGGLVGMPNAFWIFIASGLVAVAAYAVMRIRG